MTHADCLACDYRGYNERGKVWCSLFGGRKSPETPCPDPGWRDVMLRSKRLKEGKRDPG